MSFKLTLVLVVLLALVGGTVYLMEQRPEPLPDVPRTIVFGFFYDDVDAIQISHEGKVTELRREGQEQWKILRPEPAEADTRQVESLLLQLAPLNASRVLTGAVSGLSAYGLSDPKTKVSLTVAGSERHTLLVGDGTPDGSAVYARREGSDTIYVIPTTIISEAVKLAGSPPKALPTPVPASN